MKMPYIVADKYRMTARAADIDDRIHAGRTTNRNQRRFLSAFMKKCSKSFGGLKGK